MLQNDLAITVFTYNRAANLRDTLEQLASGPFARCSVTVLDNHSTDATPAVCAEFEDRFERYRVIRNGVNVGLGANYLRAVEHSEAPYSWILTDDEHFDFSDCGDVIAAIEEGEVDLISLGSPAQQQWERGLRTTTRALFDQGQRYFFVFTFVAGVIFRTEQFDDTCIAAGYRNAGNLYPQFEHIRQCLERDRPVLVSRAWITRRNVRPVEETVGSHLFWYLTALRSIALIDDPVIRHRANWDMSASRRAWVIDLAARIAMERIDRPQHLFRELGEVLLLVEPGQRLIVAALTPLAFVPRGPMRGFRRLLRRVRGIVGAPEDTPDYDELRL